MKRLATSSLLLALAALTTSAETYTWTGGGNGMGWIWEPGLWDVSGEPGPEDTAYFVTIPMFENRRISGKWQNISVTTDVHIDTLQFGDCGGVSTGANTAGFKFIFNHVIGDAYDGIYEVATNNVSGANNWLGITNATIHAGENRILTFGDLNALQPDTSIAITGPGTVILNGGLPDGNVTGTVSVEQGTFIVKPDWRNNTFRGPFILGDGIHRATFQTGSNHHNHFTNTSEITINTNSVMRFHERPNDPVLYLQRIHILGGELDLANILFFFQQYGMESLIELAGGTVTNGAIQINGPNRDTPVFVTLSSDKTSTLYSDLKVGGYAIHCDIADGEVPIDCEIAGQIKGGIRLFKEGAGTWLWSNPNGSPEYYRVGHTVEVLEGSLIVNNLYNSGVGSNDVNVASGALLGGTGRIFGQKDVTWGNYGVRGNVTLTGGEAGPATFAPGTPDPATGAWIPGTFYVGFEAFTNNVTFGNSSVLRCEVTPQGASSLDITGWLFCNSAQNTDALELRHTGRRLPTGSYTLASFTNGLKGRFDAVTINGTPLEETTAKLYYLDEQGNPIVANSFEGAGRIVIEVPPEETILLFR